MGKSRNPVILKTFRTYEWLYSHIFTYDYRSNVSIVLHLQMGFDNQSNKRVQTVLKL
jgi:hypothetical protein